MDASKAFPGTCPLEEEFQFEALPLGQGSGGEENNVFAGNFLDKQLHARRVIGGPGLVVVDPGSTSGGVFAAVTEQKVLPPVSGWGVSSFRSPKEFMSGPRMS